MSLLYYNDLLFENIKSNGSEYENESYLVVKIRFLSTISMSNLYTLII